MIAELYKATLSHGGRTLFADMSFVAAPGERVALVGMNRSDAAVLMQTILGMHRLDSGWVCFDGEPVLPKVAAWFRRKVAYVPQAFAFGRVTVADVAAAMSGENANSDCSYSASGVGDSLEVLGVSRDKLERNFASLDAAEAQRALIALTFGFERPVALFDNPTSEQDEHGRCLVANYIASPRFDDVSVIVATDDHVVINSCNKIVRVG